MEAERSAKGVLTLALGCWFRPDFGFLATPAQRAFLDKAIGRMLEDQVSIVVVGWPAGWANGSTIDDSIDPPDLLAGLTDAQRMRAESCESPLQKHFFAHCCRAGLVASCQHPIANYRLDFAFPEERVAVEVIGWNWHRRGGGAPREREERLGVDNWRMRWFSGEQVAEGAERCVDQVAEMLRETQGLLTRRYRQTPAAGIRSPYGGGNVPFPRRRGPRGLR